MSDNTEPTGDQVPPRPQPPIGSNGQGKPPPIPPAAESVFERAIRARDEQAARPVVRVTKKPSRIKFLNKTFIALLEKQDSGWVDYYFPKPGTSQIAKKWAFIKPVDFQGMQGGVGAGIYLD
jgi:hypothetical protein